MFWFSRKVLALPSPTQNIHPLHSTTLFKQKLVEDLAYRPGELTKVWVPCSMYLHWNICLLVIKFDSDRNDSQCSCSEVLQNQVQPSPQQLCYHLHDNHVMTMANVMAAMATTSNCQDSCQLNKTKLYPWCHCPCRLQRRTRLHVNSDGQYSTWKPADLKELLIFHHDVSRRTLWLVHSCIVDEFMISLNLYVRLFSLCMIPPSTAVSANLNTKWQQIFCTHTKSWQHALASTIWICLCLTTLGAGAHSSHGAACALSSPSVSACI